MINTELPSGWESARLEEVCVPIAKVGRDGHGRERFRYIDIGSVDSQTNRVRDVEWVDSSRAPSRARQIIRSGDVLYSTVRPYLRKIAAVPDDLDGHVASTGFAVLRSREEIEPRYIFYAVLAGGFAAQVLPKQRGVSYPAVREADVLSASIPIPPLAEQRRIAEALDGHFSRIDAAVRNLEVARSRAARLRRAVIKQAMSGRLADQAPTDQPVGEMIQNIERAVRDAGTVKRRRPGAAVDPGVHFSAPAHWLVRPLSSLCLRIDYGTSAKAHATPSLGDIPVLRMGNIQDGEIDLRDLKYLPGDHPDVEKLELADGDLLFNRTNSAELVGKAAVYRSEMGPATFASYLIRCRLADGIEPDWVNLCINSPEGRRYINSVVSQQVGQANVNGTKLGAFPIPVPPRGEQLRIIAATRDWGDRFQYSVDAANRSLHRAVHLRSSLMEHAFAGALIPQNPADEPASVLLSRIRASQRMGRKGRRQRKTATVAESSPSRGLAAVIPPHSLSATQQEFEL